MTRHFHLALCSAFVFLTLFILQADARTCVFAQDSDFNSIMGERRALLIAVSRYANGFSELPSTDNDVELMKKELLKFGFKGQNIRVLQLFSRKMPTRENISEAVEDFSVSCESEDLAFIMLTGHGLRNEETGKDFFLPLDAESGNFDTYIPLDSVIDRLESSKAKFKWLLVDACREFGKGVSDGQVLGTLTPKPGMLIFQSSSAGEISKTTNFDGSGNGIFIYNFIQGLQGGAIREDGRVTVFGAFAYARDKIKDIQHPKMSFNDFDDFFLFENKDWVDAAKHAKAAQEALEVNNSKQAKAEINLALIYDSPLHDDYVKKAELIGRFFGEGDSVPLPQDYTDMRDCEFRLIKAGSFMMGSKLTGKDLLEKYPNGGSPELYDDNPRHMVTLTQNFYICKYPVTLGEFRKFVDETKYKTSAEKEGGGVAFDDDLYFGKNVVGVNWQNPGFEQNDRHPVVCISYDDALAYIKWLNDQTKADDRLGGAKPLYRLPTEEEWEYCCRAGTTGEFFWGNEEQDGEGYLNGADETKNSAKVRWPFCFSFSDDYWATSPVGKFKSNPWGLYDMLGNVCEWTSDWYDGSLDNLSDELSVPKAYRVTRGGCWAYGPMVCRCAFRNGDPPFVGSVFNGFRIAFSITTEDILHKEINEDDGIIKDCSEGKEDKESGVSESNIIPQNYIDRNGSDFHLIKADSFMMGSKLTADEVYEKYPNPFPTSLKILCSDSCHRVTLTQDFYLCKHPVTLGEFRKFVDATEYKTEAEERGFAKTITNGKLKKVNGTTWKNTGFEQTDNHPVVCVSYNDALSYIRWLNDESKADDKLGGAKPLYRLPTEAEWEYCCRAGTTSEYFWGDEEKEGKGYLNGADETSAPQGSNNHYHFSFSDDYFATSPIGSFQSNPWELYDMLGNVLEWTSDGYEAYPTDEVTDPHGTSTESNRVTRGGSWASLPINCRCASRWPLEPSDATSYVGFRVAFSLTKEDSDATKEKEDK